MIIDDDDKYIVIDNMHEHKKVNLSPDTTELLNQCLGDFVHNAILCDHYLNDVYQHTLEI